MAYVSFTMTKRSRLQFSPRFAHAQKDILMTHLQKNNDGRIIRAPKWFNQIRILIAANLDLDQLDGATPFEITECLTAIVEIPDEHVQGETEKARCDALTSTLLEKLSWTVKDWDGDNELIGMAIPELTLISRERAHNPSFWSECISNAESER